MARLQAATSAQDYTLAMNLVQEFHQMFTSRWNATHENKAAASQLLEQSLEAARKAVQVCALHRQMLGELLNQVSVSDRYCETARNSQRFNVEF